MIKLKPGLLVSVKTKLTGGVQYDRVDLANRTEGAATVAKWETTRVIEDQAEFDRATKARSEAACAIRRHCIPSAFGLLCPYDRREALEAGIVEAAEIVRDWNAAKPRTRLAVYVLRGEIATTDQEAARAISAEVRELVAEMRAGIDGLDPERIRKAATTAKQLGAMFSEEQGVRVGEAVKQARQAAREIVERVQKNGERAEVVIGTLNTSAVNENRFAFLDIDAATQDGAEPAAQTVDAAPAVSEARFAGLELFRGEPAEAAPETAGV